jgi:hypothetical protein
LASAFQLLTRALGELPNPVGHEALRARMAALHGREDQLLEPSRFARLLRQANDAEIADVRTVGVDSYEVSPHRTDLSFARTTAAAEPVASGVGANGSEAQPAAVEPAPRVAALRFRRGSRAPLRLPDMPLVGVVRMDDVVPPPEPTALEPETKKKAAPRRRARPKKSG